MLSMQKSLFLKIGVIVIALIFNNKVYGQSKQGWGEIIEVNGSKNNSVTISITENLSERKNISVTSGDKIESGSIIIVPKNTSIVIKSFNTNRLTIETEEDERIIEYIVSRSREIYQIRDEKNNSGNIFVETFKKLTGPVLVANPSRRQNTAAKNTKWKVWNKGTNLQASQVDGKIALNYRYKIEMEDSIVNFQNSKKRVLYLTKKIEDSIQFLNPKNKDYSFKPERLNVPQLNTDESIDNFFKEELQKQTRFLKSSGPQSKLGFSALNNGRYEEGIRSYEKAIDSGEMTTERFIQASLILTEGYYEKQVKKTLAKKGLVGNSINKELWLDASLYFIHKVDSIRNKKYEFYTSDNLKGDYSDITNFLGHDLILYKEYLAWAYTVKLKLNGCLESMQYNPKRILKQAEEIKKNL